MSRRTLTSPARQIQERARLERELLAALEGPLSRFLDGVAEDALAAYVGASVLVAAGAQPAAEMPQRAERGRFVADPFSYTQVRRRWQEAVRELTYQPRHIVKDADIVRVLEQADLPMRVFEDVKDALQQGRSKNFTRLGMKRALNSVLVPRVQADQDPGAYRALVRQMARTAATEAQNRRLQGLATQAGFGYKMWMTRRDGRVRHSHSEADAQVVPVDQPFRVGVALLMYPGDPAGPAEETANCRCVLVATDNPTLVASASAEHRADRDKETPMTGTLPFGHPLTQFAAHAELRLRLPVTYTAGEPDPADGKADVRLDLAEGFDLGAELERALTDVLNGEAAGGDLAVENDEDGPDTADGENSRENAEDAPQDGENEVRWSGVIGLETVMTGDGRYLEAGSLAWDAEDMPLPLRYVSKDTGAHDNAETVGRIESIERRDGGVLYGTGTISTATEAGREAVGKLARGDQRGVSMDLDEMEFEVRVARELIEAEADPVLVEDEDGGTERAEVDEEGRVTVARVKADDEVVVVSSALVRAATLVAVPAFRQAKIELAGDDVPAGDALTASAFEQVPDAAVFADPRLTGPTPLTVTEDGRVFGHLAAWGVCHIGMTSGGECITPPNSGNAYASFHTSSLPTTEGTLAVGKLTVGTGHAGGKLGARPALAHYDHTGTTAAFVRAGEDAHGIWVAGIVSPDATPAQVRALATSPLSGDWRVVQGQLELVAALAVNVPGFPIPRPAGLVAAGEVRTLVAAGMMPPAKLARQGTPGALKEGDLAYLRATIKRARARSEERAAKARAERAAEMAETVAATRGRELAARAAAADRSNVTTEETKEG